MKAKGVRRLAAAALALVMVMGLAACGSSSSDSSSSETASEAELTGYYASTQNVSFFSAYPEYTYKQAGFGSQSLELYDDGTYVLTDVETYYSGSLEFSDDGTYEVVPRGTDTFKYYGTYTSEEESGLMTVTLSSPTAVIAAQLFSASTDSSGYLNTENWDDDMAAAAGGDEGSLTAEEYLATVAFEEVSLIVDTETDSFDYTTLTVAE